MLARVRVTLAIMVVAAVLMIGGNVRAQSFFDNPELSDVVDAVFFDTSKSGFSWVVAQLNGGSNIL